MKTNLLIILLFLVSCSKKPGCTHPDALNFDIDAQLDDGSCVFENNPRLINYRITQDKTLTNDSIWILDGRITVENGATLTIEPGTIIKSRSGSGASCTVLIVTKEGKINAIGTPEEPIIFTSTSDDIQLGEIVSPNLMPWANGMWGGIILLGNAPGSFPGNVTELQIEGVPATDLAGRMGGNNPHHDGGVMKYVSIRHCGTDIGAGNEINGLTFGCVGDGTIVSHIEVIGTTDDAFEFFGGNIHASYLIADRYADDGIDIDQGFNGKVSNSIIITGPASDHSMEIDGPEGSLVGNFELDSIFLYGSSDNCMAPGIGGEIASLRDGARGVLKNIYAIHYALGSDIDMEPGVSAGTYSNSELQFESVYIKKPMDDWGNECFGLDITNIYHDRGNSTFVQDASNWTTFINYNPLSEITNKEFSWTYYLNF